MTEIEGSKGKQGYDPNYEQGRCPYGYVYVPAFIRDGVWVHGYCKKIKKVRFFEKPGCLIFICKKCRR